MKKIVQHKVIISGLILDIITLIKNQNQKSTKKIKKKKRKKSRAEKNKSRKDNLYRAKSRLKRLISSNPDLIKFITLTFEKKITNIKDANYIFQGFIRRMNKKFKNFKYIAVPEFQRDFDYKGESNARVHYHLICNIKDFVANSYIKEIWNHGHVNVKDLKEGYIEYYLSKYLTKDIDSRLFGRRKYLYSQNCSKPLVFNKVDFMLINELVNDLKMLYAKEIPFEWDAQINYFKYLIPDINHKTCIIKKIVNFYLQDINKEKGIIKEKSNIENKLYQSKLPLGITNKLDIFK